MNFDEAYWFINRIVDCCFLHPRGTYGSSGHLFSVTLILSRTPRDIVNGEKLDKKSRFAA